MEDVRQRLGEWGLTELEIVFSGEIQLEITCSVVGSKYYRSGLMLVCFIKW